MTSASFLDPRRCRWREAPSPQRLPSPTIPACRTNRLARHHHAGGEGEFVESLSRIAASTCARARSPSVRSPHRDLRRDPYFFGSRQEDDERALPEHGGRLDFRNLFVDDGDVDHAPSSCRSTRSRYDRNHAGLIQIAGNTARAGQLAYISYIEALIRAVDAEPRRWDRVDESSSLPGAGAVVATAMSSARVRKRTGYRRVSSRPRHQVPRPSFLNTWWTRPGRTARHRVSLIKGQPDSATAVCLPLKRPKRPILKWEEQRDHMFEAVEATRTATRANRQGGYLDLGARHVTRTMTGRHRDRGALRRQDLDFDQNDIGVQSNSSIRSRTRRSAMPFFRTSRAQASRQCLSSIPATNAGRRRRRRSTVEIGSRSPDSPAYRRTAHRRARSSPRRCGSRTSRTPPHADRRQPGTPRFVDTRRPGSATASARRTRRGGRLQPGRQAHRPHRPARACATCVSSACGTASSWPRARPCIRWWNSRRHRRLEAARAPRHRRTVSNRR